MGVSGQDRNPVVQSAVSHHTDWATPAPRNGMLIRANVRYGSVAGSCGHGNEHSGSIKMVNFLASWATIGFSRRSLIHGSILDIIFLPFSLFPPSVSVFFLCVSFVAFSYSSLLHSSLTVTSCLVRFFLPFLRSIFKFSLFLSGIM
jgi:hypothetical protein